MNPDLSAEFHLSSSALPLVGLAAAISDTRLELDEVLQTAGETVFLCWFEADSFDPVEVALDADTSIAAWSLLEATEHRRLYRLRMADSVEIQVAIEGAFIERGATPIHATITDDGWLMRARFPDRPTLAAYRESCQKRGISFVLERLYEPTDTRGDKGLTLAGLTPKQYEALLLAHEAGYYDLPKATTLADLSDHLSISRRSLSDRLRRAERQLVETAITNDRLHSRE